MMRNERRENLVNPDIWIRAFYMILFMIVYFFAKTIIGFVAFFQFVSVLLTGRANLPLLSFGKNLSVFIYEILEFQTFNTEIRPFPFTAWPEEDHGGDIWLDEQEESVYEEGIVEEEMPKEEPAAEEAEEEVEKTVEAEQASSEETKDKPEGK